MRHSCLAIAVALLPTMTKADYLTAANLSGSIRLANFVASEQMRSSPSMADLQSFVSSSAKLGFNITDPQAPVTGLRDLSYGFRPILSYDPNANGGNPSDRLDLGGGTYLQFDPDSVAQGSLVAGASFNTSAKYFYDRGRFLELGLSAGQSWSLNEGHPITTWSINTCSENHLFDWNYLDFCATRSAQNKELSSSINDRVEARLTHLMNIGASPTELRMKWFRQDQSGGWNSGIGADLILLTADSAAVSLGGEAELAPSEDARQNYSIHAGLQMMAFGRPVSITISQSQMVHAQILGEYHDDTTTTLSLSVPLTPSISGQMSVSQTESNLDFYDQQTVGINIAVTDLKALLR